jgi:glutamate-1-semialdehyde 2,1-aminomutase
MKLTKEKLWKKAKRVILGGNLLLSKRPEMFLPEYWPTYFKKAKGINVWDLKNRKYIDMIFAVGQSTLGYANKYVDNEVQKNLIKGNMTTLNCAEEVQLAQKLVDIHPWSDMAKFTRSGGEANALAVRIARAASGKDCVAICGYHGWHDWYLSINLASKNSLNDHLLPGLEPLGVPKSLKNNVIPFKKNDIKDLEKISKKFDLGVVKVEIARNELPDKIFLKKLRKFCDEKKIILIFDECTSGFRRNLGGIHMTTGIYPDLAMFGKALGNGYAINAIIGKKKIMRAAEKSFISSTFWTERIGFVAANKTLDFMKKKKSYKSLIANGKYLNSKWMELAQKYNLKININGIESITSFTFENNNLLYKTFISQEMLKYGYLASNLVYLSILHKKKIIDRYIFYLDKVFKKIKLHQKSKKNYRILKGPISHSTFKRLTD